MSGRTGLARGRRSAFVRSAMVLVLSGAVVAIAPARSHADPATPEISSNDTAITTPERAPAVGAVTPTAPRWETRPALGSLTAAGLAATATDAALGADGRYIVAATPTSAGGDAVGTLRRRDRLSGAVVDVVPAAVNGSTAICRTPSIAAGGSVVVFTTAGRLVTDDTNGVDDVYLRRLDTGTIELVSRRSTGTAANGRSWSSTQAVSADGRFVVFDSCASDVVPGDANGACDVFVRDRTAATTSRLSTAPTGGALAAGGSDGRISGDGATAAFLTADATLTAGSGLGGPVSVVRGRANAALEVASIDVTGARIAVTGGVALSGDGRSIAFAAGDRVLVRRRASTTTPVVPAATKLVTTLAGAAVDGISNAGTVVVARGTRSGAATPAALVIDVDPARVTPSTVVEQPVAARRPARGALSADGRHAVLGDGQDRLWAYDRLDGGGALASPASGPTLGAGAVVPVALTSTGRVPFGWSGEPALSPNGQVVAFSSTSPDVVPGDANAVSDVFVSDRTARTTKLVSASTKGAAGNGASARPAVARDGLVVGFESAASDLVAGDTNGRVDVFARRTDTNWTELVSKPQSAATANNDSWLIGLSADGRFAVYTSLATNLVGGDTNAVSDVFVRDRWTGTTTRASVDASGRQLAKGGGCGRISADGSTVAFVTQDAALSPTKAWAVVVRPVAGGVPQLVSLLPDGSVASPRDCALALSGDGQVVAFEVARSGRSELYARDRTAARTTGPLGASPPLTAATRLLGLSRDGRFVLAPAPSATDGGMSGTNDFTVLDTRLAVSEIAPAATLPAPSGALAADGYHAVAASGVVTAIDTYGPLTAIDISQRIGLSYSGETYSAHALDRDGDGVSDLVWVVFHDQASVLYERRGGAFVPIGTYPTVDAGTGNWDDRHRCAWLDWNRDGVPDIACTAGRAYPLNWVKTADIDNHAYEGAMVGGVLTMTEKGTEIGLGDPYGRGRNQIVIDANGDGWPDLYTTNETPLAGDPDAALGTNHLFLNVSDPAGGRRFVDAPSFGLDLTLGHGRCGRAWDRTGDGRQDLMVCTADGPHLYDNVDGTRFVDVTAAAGVNLPSSSEVELNDIDRDGDLDLVAVRWNSVAIQTNTGGRFAAPVTVATWADGGGQALAIGDVDADGDKDVYVLRSVSPVDMTDFFLLQSSGLRFPTRVDLTATAGQGDDVETIRLPGAACDVMIDLNGREDVIGPVRVMKLPARAPGCHCAGKYATSRAGGGGEP